MLNIQVRDTYNPERRYIQSVLFNEFLKLDFRIEYTGWQDVQITLDDEKTLRIADGLFAVPENQWLQPASQILL